MFDAALIDNFILGMKTREEEHRRLSDDHLIKATTVQGERMKLESYLHKLRQTATQNHEN